MNARNIGYWAATGFFTLSFASGGVFDLVQAPPAVEVMAHLGYPAYVASILGAWKVLGGIALLIPRFPRLKEWAYAGVAFDLTGAAMSHATVGDGPAHVIAPLVLLAVAVSSWALRPASRSMVAKKTSTPATQRVVAHDINGRLAA